MKYPTIDQDLERLVGLFLSGFGIPVLIRPSQGSGLTRQPSPTDANTSSIELKILDDPIFHNFGQFMIHSHNHSPVPFAGRYPFWIFFGHVFALFGFAITP